MSSDQPTATDAAESKPLGRILVVEDDAAVAAGIVRGLIGAGYDVDLVRDGAEAATRIIGDDHDLVILDLMLPSLDGFGVLEAVRDRTSKPIIVLSARDALDDRLQAFECGAVDFMPKPFWMEELLARITTRLGGQPVQPEIVRWSDAALDPGARVVRVAAVDVGLTAHEFNVLAYLVSRPNRAITRGQLADNALPLGGDRDDRTINSHIARIRKKLGPSAAESVVTVWGIGYRFEPEAGS